MFIFNLTETDFYGGDSVVNLNIIPHGFAYLAKERMRNDRTSHQSRLGRIWVKRGKLVNVVITGDGFCAVFLRFGRRHRPCAPHGKVANPQSIPWKPNRYYACWDFTTPPGRFVTTLCVVCAGTVYAVKTQCIRRESKNIMMGVHRVVWPRKSVIRLYLYII